MKVCVTCKKPGIFGNDKSQPDGLQLRCKSCKSEADRKYRQTHKEEVKAKKAVAYQANIEEERAKRREYERTHREEARQRSLKFKINNREHLRAYSREYYKQGGEDRKSYMRNAAHIRRSRLQSAEIIDFTAAQWLELLEKYSYCCAYCFVSGVKLEQEHIVPISKGGNHTKDNIVPACVSCNRSKSDKDVKSWLIVGED